MFFMLFGCPIVPGVCLHSISGTSTVIRSRSTRFISTRFIIIRGITGCLSLELLLGVGLALWLWLWLRLRLRLRFIFAAHFCVVGSNVKKGNAKQGDTTRYEDSQGKQQQKTEQDLAVSKHPQTLGVCLYLDHHHHDLTRHRHTHQLVIKRQLTANDTHT